MKISILIVNYNVEYFLYQCLDSLKRAVKNIDHEIIVVDNNSIDQSVIMLQENFPDVHLIRNKKNVGYSKANNQALEVAQGEYVLLLNPDTIVSEDTISKCLAYFEKNDKTCGLGIKMVDGSGQFLPESKRSFPTPAVAFYKLFGLAEQFPMSKRFGKYHLTYLSKNNNHEVEVLSGAFLLTKSKVLKKAGGLDEAFFMYGEDIDLSYKLLKNNCKNIYFADSKIIHYKGESTKKGTLNYVKHFYNAMIIFAKKHYKQRKAKLFVAIMQLAIVFRGFLTLTSQFIKKIGLFSVDMIISYIGMLLTKEVWEIAKKDIESYPDELLYINFPIYLVVFGISMYFSGAYDRPYRFSKIVRGAIYGVLVIAVIYAFFPNDWRFSRALILLSGVATAIAYSLVRVLIETMSTRKFYLSGLRKRSVIIVGEQSSLYLSDEKILPSPEFVFLGLVTNLKAFNGMILGHISELKQIVKKLKPTDIIFDTEVLEYKQIVHFFESLSDGNIKFHTSLKKGEIIVSSHSKEMNGNIFLKDQNFKIDKEEEKRKKRLLDVFFSLSVLLFSPVLIWFQKNKRQFFANIFQVLLNKKTWVGYQNEHLPQIKKSVIQVSPYEKIKIPIVAKQKIERDYAKYYTVYEDMDILQRNLNNLDQSN